MREAGDYKVQAGMPAEVYIEGPSQTPLQYLAEPITSGIRKAGRQL
jgi:HlyD family secretion protein